MRQNLNFSLKEFKEFSRNIIAIDGKYYEEKHTCIKGDRKIILPLSSDRTFCIQLNNDELE